jgi:hypothetical protein
MKVLSRLMTSLVAGLMLLQGVAFAQTKVSGKVTDADGKPLAGVTVMVKGTTNGTMTDMDGTYSLRVSQGDVLEFSCLGLATQEHNYKGQQPECIHEGRRPLSGRCSGGGLRYGQERNPDGRRERHQG